MARQNPIIARQRRHTRVREKVPGVTGRVRLAVFRSLNHIYAQIIDDSQGKTIVSAGTVEKEIKKSSGKTKTAEAQMVGKLIAEKAREKGITQVVFDRGGFRYHGRIKALAAAAREAGLKF